MLILESRIFTRAGLRKETLAQEGEIGFRLSPEFPLAGLEELWMVSLKKPGRVFYGWWIVVACFFLSFYVSGVVFYGFTAIFRPIVEEFGWSYVEVSLASSIRGMEGGLLAPLLGLVIDRWGARKLMVAGVISAALGLLLMSQMQSLAMFYLSSILTAVGSSSVGISITTTVVGNWFRKRLGLATGIMICGHGASGLLVPVIVRLVDLYEWRLAVLILAIGMFTLGLPLATVVRSRPQRYGYLPDGDESPSFVDTSDLTRLTAEDGIGAKAAFGSRTIWHIIGGLFPQFIAVGALFTHVMPYLSSVGFSRSLSSLVTTTIPLISIAGRFGSGWLSDRYDKRVLSTVAIAGLAISLVCFEFVSSGSGLLLVIFVLLFGLGYGGNLSMLGILLRDNFGSRSYGTIIGFTWGILLLGNVVGPPFVAWFFDTWGKYTYSWLVLAGITFLGGLLMAMTPRSGEKR